MMAAMYDPLSVRVTVPYPVACIHRQARRSRLPVGAGSVAGVVSVVAACGGAGCGDGSRFCAWRFQSAASFCQWSRLLPHVGKLLAQERNHGIGGSVTLQGRLPCTWP